jgi:hypothetical protein
MSYEQLRAGVTLAVRMRQPLSPDLHAALFRKAVPFDYKLWCLRVWYVDHTKPKRT